ncbi:MerR family transcriptional regulator [Dactylosporangium vinaceum]|uniref:MerR family transcriptional regulator n=1 Tax=Dactylosporangium vinaceum TaxID=53362 RepID=A0ABV5M8F0_9ACTN|nr:MerR family transcriptional regulator [Dactylosporangium vinaceum]
MEYEDRLTIGAFARAAGVTPSALRFYDECGLVRPAFVDAATGYRYYRPAQVDEVVLIRRLRAAGLPLADVRRVLAGPVGAAEVLLADHLEAMERAVAEARATVASTLALLRDRQRSSVTVPGRLLADAIGQVAGAADATGDVPVLGGVLLELAGGELRLVATDRYRLAIRSLRPELRRGADASAVVAAAQLWHHRAWLGAQDVVRLRFGGPALHLGERPLPAIAEPYPDYRVVLRQLPEPVTTVVAARRPLLRALGDDPAARLDLLVDKGLRVRSSARPAAAVDVPADVRGEPSAVSFRFTTLQPAVAAGVGPDVLLRIGPPGQPAVVRSADDSDFTILAMPCEETQ